MDGPLGSCASQRSLLQEVLYIISGMTIKVMKAMFVYFATISWLHFQSDLVVFRSKAKVLYKYTKVGGNRLKEDAKLLNVIGAKEEDRTVLEFWMKGLSLQHQSCRRWFDDCIFLHLPSLACCTLDSLILQHLTQIKPPMGSIYCPWACLLLFYY